MGVEREGWGWGKGVVVSWSGSRGERGWGTGVVVSWSVSRGEREGQGW